MSARNPFGNLTREMIASSHGHAIDPHPPAPYTAALSERVAQMVEHVTFNHGVLGSIPSALTRNHLKINSLKIPSTYSLSATANR